MEEEDIKPDVSNLDACTSLNNMKFEIDIEIKKEDIDYDDQLCGTALTNNKIELPNIDDCMDGLTSSATTSQYSGDGDSKTNLTIPPSIETMSHSLLQNEVEMAEITVSEVQQSSKATKVFNLDDFYIPSVVIRLPNGQIGIPKRVSKFEDTPKDVARKKEKRGKRRIKRLCPECKRYRIELPSHMVKKHNYSKERASKINLITNQRVRYSKNPKLKNRERVACPINGCSSYVLSIRDHFRNIHPKMLKKREKADHVKEENLYSLDIDDPNNVEIVPVHAAPIETPKVNEEGRSLPDGTSVEAAILDIIEDNNFSPLEKPSDQYELPDSLASLIDDFSEWMTGPKGGKNKPATADQNTQMIRRLCIDIEAKSLKDILDDTLLWRLFLSKKNSSAWAEKTARGYVVAMKKLLFFILMDNRSNLNDRDLARDIITDLPNWSRSYENQFVKKRLVHPGRLVDPKKVNMYKASDEYRAAVKLLDICHQDDFVLTERKFSLLRAFLLFNINLRNGCRAGVLAELTLKSFKKKLKAKHKMTGTTDFIITIVNHRTIGEPAKLSLSAQMISHMKLYLKYVRSKVNPPSDHFFTTFEGVPLANSSSISQHVNRYPAAGGIGNAASKDLHQSAAAITKSVDPTKKEANTQHLNHSVSTDVIKTD